LLKVSIPQFYQNEQRYILDVMLGEFFRLYFEISEHNEPNIKISMLACPSLNKLNYVKQG